MIFFHQASGKNQNTSVNDTQPSKLAISMSTSNAKNEGEERLNFNRESLCPGNGEREP